MHDINWLLAVGLFFITAVLDALYVFYTRAVVDSKAVKASLMSLMYYVLGAIGVVSYVHNKYYLVPLALGTVVGTYWAVKYEGREK